MSSQINAMDYFQIQQVLARYCRGIDRLDRALLEQTYWEDGFDDHAVFRGKPAEFIDWVLDYLSKDKCSMHTLGQTLFAPQAPRVAAETYFNTQHVRSDAGGEFIGYSSGRYVDVFEKRQGEWRILTRTLILDIRHRKPLDEHASFAAFAPASVGKHGRDDESYRFLATSKVRA
jgi:hypothetical protein